MKDITRLVVNAESPQILTFQNRRSGFGSKISYDYFKRKCVTNPCPRNTKLVSEKINHERINSAIPYGESAYFLLKNSNDNFLGPNYLGFVNLSTFSLNELAPDIDLENSFFLNIYDSSLNCEEKSTTHLVLDNTHGGGFASLYKLFEDGKYNSCNNHFFMDLIWSEKRDSYLILRNWKDLDSKNGIMVSNDACNKYFELKERAKKGEKVVQVTDCNGVFINGGIQNKQLFIQTNISHPSSEIIKKLETSKTYEEIFEK